MDLELSGKTAVVTGGSKGISLATVRAPLAEGMRVVTGSRSVTPALAETAAVPVTVDLATPEGPVELVERALAELGDIDVLVNNVGIGTWKTSTRACCATCSTCQTAPGSTP
jgi:NAD(P)-dependent dehydrogenase (short-subunit alcohol dehydrogenase family)